MEKRALINQDSLMNILLVVCIVIIGIFSFIDIPIFNNEISNVMFENIVVRLLAGIVFMFIMFTLGYKKMFRIDKTIFLSSLLIVPGIVVAINNFPISAYLNGRTELIEPVYTVYLFFFQTLSTGFFEEIIFRGLILVFILQKMPKDLKGVFYSIVISSAIFGLIHILNLFVGAGFGPTILQVGYSFLMGMLWAVFFLKTKNIWLVMILHALYNFFGQVMFTLGVVDNRYDTITIVITIALGIMVALYAVYLLFTIKINDLEEMYVPEKESAEVGL